VKNTLLPRQPLVDSQPKIKAPRKQWPQIAVRVLVFFVVAFSIGWVLNRISTRLERTARPAGFSRGLLQGALMPMAMPNLLIGRDVAIYAPNNKGVVYKLGYTMGVNGCGAIFFGFFFWRLNRWRKSDAAE
jgi:hypothetical protein